jgi:nicotinate-nucleotide adenylyltransferase
LPWQKIGDRAVTAAWDRFALVDAAVRDVEGLQASAMEIERGDLSYTIDTVDALRERSVADDLHLIVGADVAPELGTWRESERLRTEVTLVVMNRAGAPPVDLGALAGWNVLPVEIPALEISSSDLRDRAAHGRPLSFLVPDVAIRIIEERGLYALGR